MIRNAQEIEPVNWIELMANFYAVLVGNIRTEFYIFSIFQKRVLLLILSCILVPHFMNAGILQQAMWSSGIPSRLQKRVPCLELEREQFLTTHFL